jgi:hypothetical protein
VSVPDELIQITERQLADAEEAYRRDPSEANQRRIMSRWQAVLKARGGRAEVDPDLPWPTRGPGSPSDERS